MVKIFEDLAEFKGCLELNMAILGLDLGTKNIGISISDTLLRVATPLKTLSRKKFHADAEKIKSIGDKRLVCGIVLGLPKNMNGTEGPRARSTRSFAYNLSKIVTVPITFWDERLSTVAAEKVLLKADTTRKRRAKVIDSVAATYILQGALDRLHKIGPTNE